MKKIISVLAFTLLSNIYAAGTLSGTSVTNTATLDYEVANVNQDDINASDAGFVVDNKIDFIVTTVDSAVVEVVPGDNAKILTYTLTNNGNTVQDFVLTDNINSGNPFSETDNFDASISIFVDNNNNGTYESSTDTNTSVDNLAPDANVTIFMVASFASTRVDGDVSEHTLQAQVADASTGGAITTDSNGTADNPLSVDIVFGDGTGATDSANDGIFTSSNAYKIVTASITFNKTSIVTNDPIYNGGSGHGSEPHRIPGATMRYCFTVDNNGSATSFATQITDTIDANLTITNAGSIRQSIAIDCDCAGNNDVSGVITSQDVDISIGQMTGAKDDNTSSRACAYIETTINN